MSFDIDRKFKILIVDDVPQHIKILGEALRQEHEVIAATSGTRALELVKEHQPDLILLDVLMPDSNGFEVLRSLKEDLFSRDIPVIFITSLDAAEDETRGFELGAVDYIVKPFRIPVVKARVKTHLRLRHQTELLKNLANLDGLTGLPNRRFFDERYELEWRRNKRSATSMAVIMADVDHFKAYNDTYGHLEGDNCLRLVAKKLGHGTLLRAADLLARYGGEEFVALLPLTDDTGALQVAEQMRENIFSLQLPHESSPVAPHVTVSLGVASIIPTDELMPEDLIDLADKALYQAKQNGRNQAFAANSAKQSGQ